MTSDEFPQPEPRDALVPSSRRPPTADVEHRWHMAPELKRFVNTVLDGQTRPSFVFDSAARAASGTVHVVLLDCSADVRAARLRGPRQQPELANVRMDSWAAYLRGQADALDLAVIDTSLLTVSEAADQLEQIVLRLVEFEAPAT